MVSVSKEDDLRLGGELRHFLPRAAPNEAHERVDLLFTDDAGGRSLGGVVVAEPTRSDRVGRRGTSRRFSKAPRLL